MAAAAVVAAAGCLASGVVVGPSRQRAPCIARLPALLLAVAAALSLGECDR